MIHFTGPLIKGSFRVRIHPIDLESKIRCAFTTYGTFWLSRYEQKKTVRFTYEKQRIYKAADFLAQKSYGKKNTANQNMKVKWKSG